MLAMVKLTSKYNIQVVNKPKTKWTKPIIFAINHSNGHDAPSASLSIKEHFYIMAGDEVRKTTAGKLLGLNGTIWVSRTDKTSKIKAKEEAISILSKGGNILICPEGTWNTSPNKIILPLHWGIIDIAKISGAKIVPIAMNYKDSTCLVNVGEPIEINDIESKVKKIAELTDIMATLMWELLELSPVTKREYVSHDVFDRYI
jgi:1-acyl-sn-glycerol-3-phosphate acyltransferase